MNPLGKVNITRSPDFAYAIGMLATDGNLSSDGRHLNITSKDEEMALIFKSALRLTNKIGLKARGGSKEKNYFFLQFGDKLFYNFLLNIRPNPRQIQNARTNQTPLETFSRFFKRPS